MNTVCAANGKCVTVFMSQCGGNRQQLGHFIKDDEHGIAQCPTPAGVNHIGAGETVVNVRPGRETNAFLQYINKSSHVVVGNAFALSNRINKCLVDHRSKFATLCSNSLRYYTQLFLGFSCEKFNFNPALHACSIAKNICYCRKCIALNHERTTQSSRSGPVPTMVTGTPTIFSTSSTSLRALLWRLS